MTSQKSSEIKAKDLIQYIEEEVHDDEDLIDVYEQLNIKERSYTEN